jgi:hypothetical protein
MASTVKLIEMANGRRQAAITPVEGHGRRRGPATCRTSPSSSGTGIDAAIAFEATQGNLAGLDAIARLISPEAGDVARQAGRLAEATLGHLPAAAP